MQPPNEMDDFHLPNLWQYNNAFLINQAMYWMTDVTDNCPAWLEIKPAFVFPFPLATTISSSYHCFSNSLIPTVFTAQRA